MKLFKSLGILGIILFLACSGISGEENIKTLPQNQFKKQQLDSVQFYNHRSHRIKRGQKAIIRY
ncbi:MAG: hypothetical protein CMP12_10520 [Zunongwangia sp.]|jgi:hypothetical protein|uniref:Lipoprotein n=2 Tax=Zunongwangia profunda TaxID=398743 RepID=D5BLL8_ZUNPS|nr:hypothetical protein [Zunongwangia profunda]MAC65435.1 hypothetical protein [Flavobacteriaceae bacterium]MAO36321.1 hypothetical protein [Zunongwangia sp.]ADF51984.1 hypothetical protein ZPR_1649 [Zunongwangia profunda SM-A87]MAS70149.1 hypothetical protein [Zunongwangia sp.]MCC4227976.1 hypothetical protein [Zunongwangia profunda]|tara:strand:- start:350 stop:541 length:192 start_codon:yes stop_codon:yes gene_type:complete